MGTRVIEKDLDAIPAYKATGKSNRYRIEKHGLSVRFPGLFTTHFKSQADLGNFPPIGRVSPADQ